MPPQFFWDYSQIKNCIDARYGIDAIFVYVKICKYGRILSDRTGCFGFATKTIGERGSPRHWFVQTVAMLRSGIICFWHYKLSTWIGNGGGRKATPYWIATFIKLHLSNVLWYYLRAPDERPYRLFWFCNQNKWRTRFAATLNCTNGCNVTLGHNMLFNITNYLHELGAAARRYIELYKRLQCYARA